MSSDTPMADRPLPTDDHYVRVSRRAMEQHRLFGVTWELTYRCNTSCVHCYLVKPDAAGAREAAQQELGLQKCLSILDEIADLGALNITFTGGEPLLRSDLFELVQYARNLRFAVHLKTNGTLITPEVADRIADLYVATVAISLYGASAEVHDSITQVPGSFQRVVRALRLLADRGVQTIARSSLMQANIEQFGDLRSLARELGASFSADPIITMKDDGCCSPVEYTAADEDLSAYWGLLFEEKGRPRDLVERYSGPLCSAGLSQLCIGPYGEVYPCVQFREVVGNVTKQSLREIWQESPRLKQLQHLSWADFEACYACDLRSFCSPCMGMAWLEHGTVFRPSSVMCRQARARRKAWEGDPALDDPS